MCNTRTSPHGQVLTTQKSPVHSTGPDPLTTSPPQPPAHFITNRQLFEDPCAFPPSPPCEVLCGFTSQGILT